MSTAMSRDLYCDDKCVRFCDIDRMKLSFQWRLMLRHSIILTVPLISLCVSGADMVQSIFSDGYTKFDAKLLMLSPLFTTWRRHGMGILSALPVQQSMRWIHRWPIYSPHKRPATKNSDDVFVVSMSRSLNQRFSGWYIWRTLTLMWRNNCDNE